LQPIRASKLEVNGSTAYVTGTGTNLAFSGSTITFGSNAAVNFERNGARVGQIIGADGSEFKLVAQSGSGVATNLVLSGSGVDLSANTQGFNFKFADTTRSTLAYDGGTSTVTLGTTGSVSLSLSGSNGVKVVHGINGTQFINNQGSTAYLVVEADGIDARLKAAADINLRADGGDIKFTSGSSTPLTVTVTGGNANIKGANNQQVVIGAAGASGIMNISGSIVNANVGTGGFVFQRDGVDELIVNAVGTTTTISGTASQNVTLAAGTGATTLNLSGSLLNLSGSGITMFQNTTKISEIATVDARTGFFPGTDSSFDLGGPNRRWANIYTGDLHLRNERGDYTLIEEPDFLSVRFNKNGKRYKFLLERVPELDEPAR
jgi:hypothetical protein